ncbi:MAG TPA: glucuronate isomerase [Spirochaetia bacterium]|nr:glucuronate isomerase [Spirochaetia bacterium]
MKARFPDEDFLLDNDMAKDLYHDHAEHSPIHDFHCHLPVKDIAEDRQFASITEIWLGGDHYKWRAMRACGIPERLITGDASDFDKFKAWAEIVPSTIANPLYLWSHLELKRYFGVSDRLLGPDTAEEVFRTCSEQLSRRDFSVRSLLRRMSVRVLCTTDDPVDSLEHHRGLAADGTFDVTVVPGFRPDGVMAIEQPLAFNAWVDRLAAAAGVDISDWGDLIDALHRRHQYFHDNGCRISDHGIEAAYADAFTESEVGSIFRGAREGKGPDAAHARLFKSAVLRELARMDAEAGWVQQLHIGALRDINSRFFQSRGPNAGFDTIGDVPLAASLARFLDALEVRDILPRTVLYCLNPADNAVLAALAGGFPGEHVRGKVQFGPAWWFNDQPHGIREQLQALADIGLLSHFVGMTTDSRSFLSYPRHECFRRVLCSFLGAAVERGEAPKDRRLLGGMVRDICFANAARYFDIPLKTAG